VKRYSASEARKRISDLLDGAEHGEMVVIERKGVRFRVSVERAGPVRVRAAGGKPLLDIRNPAVKEGTMDLAYEPGRSRADLLAWPQKPRPRQTFPVIRLDTNALI
jgi:antitoxin (DNA-binding transcriptional repressor) of toxin-antitoxin stability system